jgi:hypothetical protein
VTIGRSSPSRPLMDISTAAGARGSGTVSALNGAQAAERRRVAGSAWSAKEGFVRRRRLNRRGRYKSLDSDGSDRLRTHAVILLLLVLVLALGQDGRLTIQVGLSLVRGILALWTSA